MKKVLLFVATVTIGISLSAQTKNEVLKAELKKYKDDQALIEKYLVKFDTLDFTVFSNQE